VPRRDPAIPYLLSLGRQEPRGDFQWSKSSGARISTWALRGPWWTPSSPPGFADLVDLTADVDTDDEDMDEAPATPFPNVSGGSDMDTDDEDAILYTGQGQQSDHSSNGFEHV